MRVYFKDTVHAASIPQNRKYADGFLVMGKDATTGEPELQFDYAMEDGVQHIDMETFVGYKFLN